MTFRGWRALSLLQTEVCSQSLFRRQLTAIILIFVYDNCLNGEVLRSLELIFFAETAASETLCEPKMKNWTNISDRKKNKPLQTCNHNKENERNKDSQSQGLFKCIDYYVIFSSGGRWHAFDASRRCLRRGGSRNIINPPLQRTWPVRSVIDIEKKKGTIWRYVLQLFWQRTSHVTWSSTVFFSRFITVQIKSTQWMQGRIPSWNTLYRHYVHRIYTRYKPYIMKVHLRATHAQYLQTYPDRLAARFQRLERWQYISRRKRIDNRVTRNSKRIHRLLIGNCVPFGTSENDTTGKTTPRTGTTHDRWWLDNDLSSERNV